MGIKISPTKDYFLRDNKRFFYLADTVWSAFTNADFKEWEEYLNYRRQQGFNTLQINILPQWDRSGSDIQISPFELTADGRMNFTRPDEKYFERAEKMVEMAYEKGFTPALVVLWCNYVKGTWGSKINPEGIIPFESVKGYVSYVAERFKRFDPIFIASGDTNFETDDAIAYYKLALDTLKEIAPDCLTTMHLGGGLWELPEVFVDSPSLDFYMFQSGHSIENQNLSYKLAQEFYKKRVKRPIINGEPCYEGHGYGNRYGRYSAFDVRKAVWQSLLSGAKAGVSYGAHGVWSWHKKGKKFKSGAFSSMPYEWQTALRFPGAWDTAFARWLFEQYDLFDIEPANDILLNETPEIRVSKSDKKIIIYSPFNVDIGLKLDISSYEWNAIELQTRKVFNPEVDIFIDHSIIKMNEFNSDVIFIGEK